MTVISPESALWAFLIQSGQCIAVDTETELLTEGETARRSSPSDWPAYMSFMPDGPTINDNIVCVYKYGETIQARIMRTGVAKGAHEMQLRIRATNYNTGYAKAVALSGVLEGINRTVLVYGSRVNSILGNPPSCALSSFARGPILHVGQDPDDDKKRDHFTINGRLTIL